MDVACYPLEELPARFEGRPLYEEDFVIAARSGHPLGKKPSLERYAAAQHVLVSPRGAARGFIDDVLAEHGLSRKIALTVPSFLWALTVIGSGDLVGALPRTLVRMHGTRFSSGGDRTRRCRSGPRACALVTTRAALTDAGVAWLMELMQKFISRARWCRSDRRRSLPTTTRSRAATVSQTRSEASPC